jgi:hypothetical protein
MLTNILVTVALRFLVTSWWKYSSNSTRQTIWWQRVLGEDALHYGIRRGGGTFCSVLSWLWEQSLFTEAHPITQKKRVSRYKRIKPYMAVACRDVRSSLKQVWESVTTRFVLESRRAVWRQNVADVRSLLEVNFSRMKLTTLKISVCDAETNS